MSWRRAVGRRPLVLLLAVAAAIVQIVATRIGGPPPSLALLRNPFAAVAAATVFWRYVLFDAGSRRRLPVLCLSALTSIVVLLVAVQRREPMPLPLLDLLVAQGAVGVAGFVFASLQGTRPAEAGHYEETARNGRQGAIEQLLTSLTLPVSASMVSFGLWASSHLNPVYDGHILLFEQHLGVSFSVLAVRSYQQLLPFSRVATACYGTVAIGLALVAAMQSRAQREYEVLTASVVAGAVGFSLYFVCPVVGPLESFGPLFPASLPDAAAASALLAVAPGPPRNGMPSLHAIWALLIWFNAQRLSAGWKRGMQLFVLLTLWTSLGLDGQHWITDLVVACPLAVAVQMVCVSGVFGDRRRWFALAGCATLVAVWLVSIRAGWLAHVPGPLAWASFAVTVWWSFAYARPSDASAVDERHSIARAAAAEREAQAVA